MPPTNLSFESIIPEIDMFSNLLAEDFPARPPTNSLVELILMFDKFKSVTSELLDSISNKPMLSDVESMVKLKMI